MQKLADMNLCGVSYSRLFLFFCACFSGILFALVWRKYEQTVELSLVHNRYSSALRDTNYEQWLERQGQELKYIVEEELHYSQSRKFELESEFLYRNIPVLCLVFVSSHKGAKAIKDTWSKRCNFVTFFGKFRDKNIPVLKVPSSTPFESFCYAFVHVIEQYQGKFGWLVITDDSTYTLLENLRYYVAPLNSSFYYYLGHPVKDFSNLYNLGTAGIILSQGGASLLSSIYKNSHDCTALKTPSWYFDQGLGKILSSFNVHPVDTRDLNLRTRFNPFSIDTMLIPGSISVFSSYWRTSVYLSEEGMGCCSDNAITFHDNSPSKMYLLEYLLYHLTVFRNSFAGLGNSPPIGRENENSLRKRKPIAENIGEPFIQYINSNMILKRKPKRSKFDEDIFLNSILDT